MKREIERRLMAMGLPKGDEILCFTGGIKSELDDEDRAAIDHVKKCGGEVYLITKDVVYGELMRNYAYVSSQPLEWGDTFGVLENCNYATSAFVSSDLTHGTFDVGMITVHCVNGSPVRIR